MKHVPVLVALALLGGCSSPGWYLAERVIYMDNLTVEVEKLSRGGRPLDAGYAHPAVVPEAKVRSVLERLAYDKGGRPRPVVRTDTVAALSAAIVEGLRATGSGTRIRFSVTNPADKTWVLPAPATTQGVAFVKPAGRLHLVFGVVDEVQEFEDEGWFDPTKESRSEVRLLPPTEARLHTEAGQEMPMWVTVEVGDTKPPPAAKVEKPAAAKTDPDVARPAVQKPEPAKPGALTPAQIVERLRLLEKMHDEGTLSGPEYRAIRKKLLQGK